jgi:hypothetical protein
VPFSNRNLIVDGNFDAWTAASAAVGSYNWPAATMYRAHTGQGGSATLSYAQFSPGQQASGMDMRAVQVAQWQQTVAHTGTPGTIGGTNTAACFYQNIENSDTFQGQSSTLSMWLWTTAGSVTIGNIVAGQQFGSGGSPSAQVAINKAVNWVVTTTPQRFSVRVDWPATFGKTRGTTANTDSIQVGLFLPPGQTFTLRTTQWQLEASDKSSSGDINGAGGAPTAFEYRGFQAEVARIERFYQTYPGMQIPIYTGGGGSITSASVTHRTVMRIAPAASASGPTYSNCTGVTFSPSPGVGGVTQTFLTGCPASTTAFAAFTLTLDARL